MPDTQPQGLDPELSLATSALWSLMTVFPSTGAISADPVFSPTLPHPLNLAQRGGALLLLVCTGA